MFFFGFLGILCITQLPGLPFMRKLPLVVRLLPTAGFAAALGAYYGTGGSVRIFGIIGIPIAEYAVGYFATWFFWLLFHPALLRCFGRSLAAASLPASSGLGKVISHSAFFIATMAAVVGGVVDWHLPYAQWLADPTVQPRTYLFSYIGMAVAFVGQIWGAARLLGGPKPEHYDGGCCDKGSGCCAPPIVDDDSSTAEDVQGTKSGQNYVTSSA